eukprot:CFRG3587T1
MLVCEVNFGKRKIQRIPEEGGSGYQVNYPYNLGTYSRPITTKSPLAQAWFDRGLAWCYGYNHEESAECFKLALMHDNECAMAHWGLAYVSGSNYNKPWETFGEEELRIALMTGCKAIKNALYIVNKQCASGKERVRSDGVENKDENVQLLMDVEVELIRATEKLFPLDTDACSYTLANAEKWTVEFADKMSEVYKRFPTDMDIVAVYAEAMMNITPWALWDLYTGNIPDGARTAIICDVLENALRNSGNGRTLIEENSSVKVSVEGVDRTEDEELCDNCKEMYKTAIKAAEDLEGTISEQYLRVEDPPVADRLEGFVGMRMHVLIRFGKWDDIIQTPMPADRKLYSVTLCTFHYAKGVAYAAKGDICSAEREQCGFIEALKNVSKTRSIFNNTCVDILAVAVEMLKGEIEYRKGNYSVAFTSLQKAIELEDTLPYDEPWGWMQPVRHAFGALALQQGSVTVAEEVYRADLGLNPTLKRSSRHPGNVWSLHGLMECMEKLGKRDTNEYIEIQNLLDLAMAEVDVPINASCACRLD